MLKNYLNITPVFSKRNAGTSNRSQLLAPYFTLFTIIRTIVLLALAVGELSSYNMYITPLS